MVRKPYTNKTIASCWGVGPQRTRACQKCRERVGCRAYARTRPRSLVELNEDVSDTKIVKKGASNVSMSQLLEWCARFSKKYGKQSFYVGPTNAVKLPEVAAKCALAGIDPSVWLEAQFYYLGQFFKDKNLAVPSNTFLGDNARNRYHRFLIAEGRAATGNVRKQEIDPDKISHAEFYYGHAVIVLGLRGASLQKYEDSIKKDYPGWDKSNWGVVGNARICAAINIADVVCQQASSRISPPARPWDWPEFKKFLKSVV